VSGFFPILEGPYGLGAGLNIVEETRTGLSQLSAQKDWVLLVLDSGRFQLPCKWRCNHGIKDYLLLSF